MKKVNFVCSESIENLFPEKFSFASNDCGKILIASYVHSLQKVHCSIQNQIHLNIEQEFQDIQSTAELYTFQSKIIQKTSYELWNFNQQSQTYIRLSISITIVTPEMLYFSSVGTLRSYLLRSSKTPHILQSTNISAIPIGSEPFCSPTVQLLPLEPTDSVLFRSSILQSLIEDEELLFQYKKAMDLLPNITNAMEAIRFYIKQKLFDSTVVIEEYQVMIFEIVDENIQLQNEVVDERKLPVFNPILSSLILVTMLLSTTCFLLYKEVKKLHRTTEILLERNEEILINTSTKYMPQIEQLLESNKNNIEIDSTKIVTELETNGIEKK